MATAPTSSGFAPVSFTAEKILQKRAFYTSIPHAQAMAEALGIRWQVSAIRAGMRRLLWGKVKAGRYLQYRYDALSDALRGHEGWGVLEVAAGYSTRGIDECRQREVYIESDLPGLIARKPGLVAAIGGAPIASHYFVELDLCSRPDMERVADLIRGLRLRRPLAIAHEGLLMYLAPAEQARARDNIRWLLQECSPDGVWITTDFSERDEHGTLLQRLMTRRLARRVQREFTRFTDDAAVHTFLGEAGLRGQKLPNLRQGDQDREARQCAEDLRAWRIALS